MWVIESVLTGAADSLIDPVYLVVYLLAGIFIRNIWWALAVGLAWPVIIEDGAWIIYPGESLPWGHVGAFIGGPIATALVWWIRNQFRGKPDESPNAG